MLHTLELEDIKKGQTVDMFMQHEISVVSVKRLFLPVQPPAGFQASLCVR